LAGERSGGLSRSGLEGREGTTVVGNEDVVGGDARAGMAVGIVGAGPAHQEAGGTGDGRQRLDAARRWAAVDRDQGFLERSGPLGGVMRIDLVRGDDLAEVELDDRDVADFRARDEPGYGADDVVEVRLAAAGAVFGR